MNDLPQRSRFRPGATVILLAPLALLVLWLMGTPADDPSRAQTTLLILTYAPMLIGLRAGVSSGILYGRGVPLGIFGLVGTLAPPLLAWLAVLATPPLGFALLAVLFAAQGAWASFALADPATGQRPGFAFAGAAVVVMLAGFLVVG